MVRVNLFITHIYITYSSPFTHGLGFDIWILGLVNLGGWVYSKRGSAKISYVNMVNLKNNSFNLYLLFISIFG